MQLLRLKAVYSVGELAAAAGLERRQLHRLLVHAGVELMTLDKGHFVTLDELELKVRSLWEGIKLAQALARELQ
jgi:hypothetical protein